MLLKLFFAWGLRGLVLFLILVVAYFVARWLQEQDERQRLVQEHKSQSTTLSRTLTLEAYIERGMAHYETSWKRRALWGIFFIPLAAVLAIIVLATAA